MLVRDKERSPNIGAFKASKFLISNWSNELAMTENNFMMVDRNKYLFIYQCTVAISFLKTI